MIYGLIVSVSRILFSCSYLFLQLCFLFVVWCRSSWLVSLPLCYRWMRYQSMRHLWPHTKAIWPLESFLVWVVPVKVGTRWWFLLLGCYLVYCIITCQQWGLKWSTCWAVILQLLEGRPWNGGFLMSNILLMIGNGDYLFWSVFSLYLNIHGVGRRRWLYYVPLRLSC